MGGAVTALPERRRRKESSNLSVPKTRIYGIPNYRRNAWGIILSSHPHPPRTSRSETSAPQSYPKPASIHKDDAKSPRIRWTQLTTHKKLLSSLKRAQLVVNLAASALIIHIPSRQGPTPYHYPSTSVKMQKFSHPLQPQQQHTYHRPS
jgi:hypothetical protein